MQNLAKSNDFYKINSKNEGISKNVEQMIFHLENIFQVQNTKNTIFISNAMGDRSQYGWQNKIYRLDEVNVKLLNHIENTSLNIDMNYYVAPYIYFSPKAKREKDFIFSYNAIIVDIDDIDIELEEIDFKGHLEPSYIVNSGGGAYLVYLLNNIPAMSKNSEKIVKLYGHVKKAIYETFGGDKKALGDNQVYRLPGTKNHKYINSYCYIVNFETIKDTQPRRYDITELRNDFLPKLEPRQVKRPLTSPTIDFKAKRLEKRGNSVSGIISTSKLRIKDIETLVKHRIDNKYNLDGKRHQILFLYALHLFYSLGKTDDYTYNVVHKRTTELNNSFLGQAIEEKAVDRACIVSRGSAERLIENKYIKIIDRYNKDEIYMYNTNTIIEDLEITEEEMKMMEQLKYEGLRQKSVSERRNAKKRQARRNEYGLTEREQQFEDNKRNVLKCLIKGMKQKEIVKELGLTQGYISKLMKSIKEEIDIKASIDFNKRNNINPDEKEFYDINKKGEVYFYNDDDTIPF